MGGDTQDLSLLVPPILTLERSWAGGQVGGDLPPPSPPGWAGGAGGGGGVLFLSCAFI